MDNLACSIIEFVQNVDLLNDHTLSETQITCLKSTYGSPLTDREREIYFRGTGRTVYDEQEQRECTFIAGRRGGKTGKIAAPIVCYEAFRDHGIPSGEEGYVMLLAPTLKQARIAFKYIRRYLLRSRILSPHIINITKDEITLDYNIIIGCYASTYDGVRGRTIVAAVCDEIAFWPDEDAANSADEVLAALLPGMATVRDAKLIKISTPFAKNGVLFREYQRRNELTYPVWQVSTFDMNPTITETMLESQRRKDEGKFRREYLAEFLDAMNAWVSPEILDPCIVRGRGDLPYRSDASYVAALDAASRNDEFVLVVLHQVADGSVIVDRVSAWRGTPETPLPFGRVLAEIRDILGSYGINTVVGDQFYSDMIAQQLMELGIFYQERNFGTHTRADIFLNLRHLMVQGKLELPDNCELIHQLRALEEHRLPLGRIDVRPSGAVRDDRAVALALAAREAVSRPAPAPSIQLGLIDNGPSPISLGLIPDHCPVSAICANFPECTDCGSCLGFVDTRVMSVRAR